MGALKGDYIGFTFNNVPSSDLGIIRTDNGSRFTESLLPTAQDKIIQVPGGDGTYFFGSYYTQKDFSISFAFDSVTEDQLRMIKQVFGDKKPHDLIFDETPYKIYTAKVTGVATINYICFGEGVTNRLYKGEGDIQFTAYSPFARAKYKYLNQYSENNKEEWATASGLLFEKGNYDQLINSQIKIYNPGDLPTDWELEVPFKKDEKGNRQSIPPVTITLDNEKLKLSGISAKANSLNQLDDLVKINSKTNLIEGYYKSLEGDYRKSGNLYNESIIAGSFFRIPCGKKSAKVAIPIYMNFDNINFTKFLNSEPLTYNIYYL